MRAIDEALLNEMFQFIAKKQFEEKRSPTQREIIAGLPHYRLNTARVYRYIGYLENKGMIEKRADGGIELLSNLDNEITRAGLLGEVRCGTPSEAISEFKGVFDLPIEFTGYGSCFVLKAEGDSMEEAGIFDKAVMAQLDDLFTRRDAVTEKQGAGALSLARQKMLADFLTGQQTLTQFDRDVFGKLVERIIVNSREDISFEFKDGTTIKAVITGIE